MHPKAVICGSFHRDPSGLRRLFRELEATGVRILSPLSIDFDVSQTIVRARNELDFSIDELEKFHLRAIKEADVVWLHAPGGYVGLSTAYELGFAKAINKPVFSFAPPEDEMLASQVLVVRSVFEALEATSFVSNV